MHRRNVAVVLLALTAAGCGSSGTKNSTPSTTAAPAVTTSTTAAVDLAKQYLDAVAPVNEATRAFEDQAAKLGDKGSAADYQRAADPLVKKFSDLDEKLLRMPWPAAIRTDVNALVTADRGMEATLSNVGSQTSFSAGAWANQLTADLGKVSAAVSIVRADLGLPPAPKP